MRFIFILILATSAFITQAQEKVPMLGEIDSLFRIEKFQLTGHLLDSLSEKHPDIIDYPIYKTFLSYNIGNEDAAADSLAALFKRHSRDWKVRVTYADLLMYQHNYAESDSITAHTYQYCGDDASCLFKTRYLHADIKVEVGDIQTAINILNENLKENPNDYYTHARLNYCYLAVNDYANSMKHGKKALQVKSDIYVENNLAFIYLMLGKYELAAKLFEILVKEEPGLYYLSSNLGFAYTQIGRFDEGIELIKNSLILKPDNSFAYRHLGLAYLSINQTNKACTYFKKALELGFTKENGTEVENLMKEHCH